MTRKDGRDGKHLDSPMTFPGRFISFGNAEVCLRILCSPAIPGSAFDALTAPLAAIELSRETGLTIGHLGLLKELIRSP